MRRTVLALGMLVLLTNTSLAQFYCEQVMQAIAIYGYEAARQYAWTHYGPEAVEAVIDVCGRGILSCYAGFAQTPDNSDAANAMNRRFGKALTSACNGAIPLLTAMFCLCFIVEEHRKITDLPCKRF